MQLRVTFSSRVGSEAEGGGSCGVSGGTAEGGCDFTGVDCIGVMMGARGNGGGGMVILGFGVDVVTAGWGAAELGAVGVEGGMERGEGVCDVFGAARMLDFVLAPGKPSMGAAGGARTGATSIPKPPGLVSGGGGMGGGAIGGGAVVGIGVGGGAVVGIGVGGGAVVGIGVDGGAVVGIGVGVGADMGADIGIAAGAPWIRGPAGLSGDGTDGVVDSTVASGFSDLRAAGSPTPFAPGASTGVVGVVVSAPPSFAASPAATDCLFLRGAFSSIDTRLPTCLPWPSWSC